jgi:hypothetical protein
MTEKVQIYTSTTVGAPSWTAAASSTILPSPIFGYFLSDVMTAHSTEEEPMIYVTGADSKTSSDMDLVQTEASSSTEISNLFPATTQSEMGADSSPTNIPNSKKEFRLFNFSRLNTLLGIVAAGCTALTFIITLMSCLIQRRLRKSIDNAQVLWRRNGSGRATVSQLPVYQAPMVYYK